MEEGEKAGAAAACCPVARIFIGGLSESVAAADLENRFSSLGSVRNVEFVRTNGRNFAYMDFEYPSDRALAKLFSTYNGCTWKGGKLSIEKAKEHYLTRLKREWAEDMAQSIRANNDVKKDQDKPRLEKFDLENKKLRIFFPKLKKVKLLPLKGTGKHKYSFRRVEVPSYPVNFCDCEEHCGPPDTANEKYASVLREAAYEKELNIMNSVMNKLFEKENQDVVSSQRHKPAADIDIMEPSHTENDFQTKEAEESNEEDLDDLVINIGVTQSDDLLIQLKEQEKQTANQESQLRKRQRFKEATAQKKRQKSVPAATETMQSQGSASMMASKSSAGSIPTTSEAIEHQETSPNLGGKGATDEFSSVLSKNKSSTDPQDSKVLMGSSSAKSKTEPNVHTAEAKKSTSWVQKSSWRDLVGEIGNTSFSISQVLPSTNVVPPKRANVVEEATASHAKSNRSKAKFGGEAPKSRQAANQLAEQKAPSSIGIPINGNVVATTAEGESKELRESNSLERGRAVPKITITEDCPFMRNAASEKEWSRAKKALTRFIKKKSNENNESNISKGKPSSRR